MQVAAMQEQIGRPVSALGADAEGELEQMLAAVPYAVGPGRRLEGKLSQQRFEAARTRKSAVSSVRLSRPNRPTICTPSGRPSSSASPGTLTQGVPIKVHSRLKIGLPVDSRPRGAAPGADGVRIASTLSMKSVSSW